MFVVNLIKNVSLLNGLRKQPIVKGNVLIKSCCKFTPPENHKILVPRLKMLTKFQDMTFFVDMDVEDTHSARPCQYAKWFFSY